MRVTSVPVPSIPFCSSIRFQFIRNGMQFHSRRTHEVEGKTRNMENHSIGRDVVKWHKRKKNIHHSSDNWIFFRISFDFTSNLNGNFIFISPSSLKFGFGVIRGEYGVRRISQTHNFPFATIWCWFCGRRCDLRCKWHHDHTSVSYKNFSSIFLCLSLFLSLTSFSFPLSVCIMCYMSLLKKFVFAPQMNMIMTRVFVPWNAGRVFRTVNATKWMADSHISDPRCAHPHIQHTLHSVHTDRTRTVWMQMWQKRRHTAARKIAFTFYLFRWNAFFVLKTNPFRGMFNIMSSLCYPMAICYAFYVSE